MAIVRALWYLATTSISGFAWAVLAFIGWVMGLSFLAIAVVKIIFPNNVGIFTIDGHFHSAGANFGLPPGTEVHPFGYWVVPLSIAIGLAILVGTQRASRRVLAWLRSREGAGTAAVSRGNQGALSRRVRGIEAEPRSSPPRCAFATPVPRLALVYREHVSIPTIS